MNGRISEEALELYNLLAAEKQGLDFSEEGTYDFARCMRPDGTYYGTRGKCRKGSEAGAAPAPGEKAFQGSGGKVGKSKKNANARGAYKAARRDVRVAQNYLKDKINDPNASRELRMGAGNRTGRARNQLAKMEAGLSGKQKLLAQMKKAEGVSRMVEEQMRKAREEASKSKLQKLAEKARSTVESIKARLKGR